MRKPQACLRDLNRNVNIFRSVKTLVPKEGKMDPTLKIKTLRQKNNPRVLMLVLCASPLPFAPMLVPR